MQFYSSFIEHSRIRLDPDVSLASRFSLLASRFCASGLPYCSISLLFFESGLGVFVFLNYGPTTDSPAIRNPKAGLPKHSTPSVNNSKETWENFLWLLSFCTTYRGLD
ncbi:uncharacterized protein LOC132603786 isoform X3 [Lycium barbarum]|nr:uncharacterized protein LOC132603786 isoform X3 [Lycium barbarum]